MKQTAVEWLVEELKKYDSAGLKDQSNYVIEMPTHILTELEEQAKEMEKEQIIASCHFAYNEGCTYMCGSTTKYKSFEQYYNETFKNQ